MRKLLTLLPVAALVLAAGCQDQPTAVRDSGGLVPDGPSMAGVAGADFTSTNPNKDPAPRCMHGPEGSTAPRTNCNLYQSKSKVWINGGPGHGGPAGLSDGVYFFAVLEPGGQGGNANPNDGMEHNLSDNVPFSTDPGLGTGGIGDPYTARRFRVENKKIVANLGTHDEDNLYDATFGLMLRVGPNFDDTRNPGGVYIMAICRISEKSSFNSTTNTYNATTDPVTPDDCKYDAFKVHEGTEPLPLDVLISIEPDDVNGIGEEHIFTITATALGGMGPYSFEITPKVEPTPNEYSTTCGTPTVDKDAGTATCTVTINSDVAGIFVATAKVKVKVTDSGTEPQTAEAETDDSDGNSGPATKEYVAGELKWSKVRSTTSAPLGGATFEVCRISDYVSATDDFIDRAAAAYVCQSVIDNGALDEDPADGAFKMTGLVLGGYRVRETAAPLNWTLDPMPQSTPTGYLSIINRSYTFSVAFVNTPKYSGETATSAGFDWKLTQNAPQNWFMYAPWVNPTKVGSVTKAGLLNSNSTGNTIDLIAGQFYDAGDITGGVVGGNRRITIKLQNNFRFAVGASSSVKVEPLSSCATSQNYIQPGQFRIKVTPTAAQALAGEVVVDAAGLSSSLRTAFNGAACYGIHVDVERPLVW